MALTGFLHNGVCWLTYTAFMSGVLAVFFGLFGAFIGLVFCAGVFLVLH